MLLPDSQFTGNEQSFSLDRYIQKLPFFSTWTKNQGLQKLSISLKSMLPNFFFPSVMRISSESFWKNSRKMLPTGLETQEEKIIIQRNTLCPGGYVSEWSLVSWGSLEICDGNWGVNLNGLLSRVLDWRAKQSCQQQTCPPPHSAQRPKISPGMNEKQLHECWRGFLLFILMDFSLNWKHFHFL